MVQKGVDLGRLSQTKMIPNLNFNGLKVAGCVKNSSFN
jgi:hypothetical protein